MKDRQGKWRVKCGIKGCDCTEYLVEDSKKIRCDYCDHSPADHCWLGSCKDSECKENEEAEEGSACTKYVTAAFSCGYVGIDYLWLHKEHVFDNWCMITY